MQKLSTTFHNVDIYSLRTGHPVGIATTPLINPKNLKVEAWYAKSRFENGLLLLPSSEIREFSHQGIAVNDRDAITPAEDLVRISPLVRIDFQLIGKKVYDEQRVFLGRVTDYSIDVQSFFIMRLYVSPRGLKQLTQNQRVISRVQIIEITAKKIVVKDASEPIKGFFRQARPEPLPEA